MVVEIGFTGFTSLKEEAWAHKTSLTPPPFIEIPVPSQESEWSCICMLGASIWPLSMLSKLFLPVWYFCLILN
jgi:hypothetical protein